MASFDEVVAQWVAYAEALEDERDQLETALSEALRVNAQLVATDAAEDAAQAEALQAELTKKLEDALAFSVGGVAAPDEVPIPDSYPIPEPYPVPPLITEGKQERPGVVKDPKASVVEGKQAK
jgi:hypothetical protein